MLVLLACAVGGVDLGDSPRPPPGSDLDTSPDELPGETGTHPDSADTAPVTYAHLPVLELTTDGPVGSGEKVAGTMVVIRDHDGTLTDLDHAPVDATWPIGIEVHGSSSAGYPKLNYRFECRDDTGEDTQCPLLDLPDGQDWLLEANYPDKTLIRNALAYQLAATLADDRGTWSQHTAFTEVYLNGDYIGVYLLTEKIQRDGDRLDLQKPAATAAEGDLSGGYIVKIDQHRGEGFDTTRGTPVDYSYPHADSITPAQRNALAVAFEDMEDAFDADDWTAQYPTRIDVDSWVDVYLVNELANNVDAYRLSAYHWKDADSIDPLIHAGPVWDFDRAWGNVNYCYTWNTYGWVYDELDQCGYAYEFPFWWPKLVTDPAFDQALRCRWEDLRTGALSDEALLAAVDAYVDELDEAEPRDDARWHTIGTWIDPNWWVGSSYAEEIDWLKTWITDRTLWMDQNLPGTCG